MFNYRRLDWTCSCGTKSSQATIGTTSHFHIIAEWRCAHCKKDMKALASLEDLARNAPEPPFELLGSDYNFLRKAHISME